MDEFADAVLAGRISKQEFNVVQGLLTQLNKISEKRESPEQLFDRVFVDELEKIHAEGENDVLVAEALAGYDTEQAWKIREEILASDHEDDLESVVIGLAGLDRPQAWELRRKAARKKLFGAVARSLTGLDNEASIKMRGDLLTRGKHDLEKPGSDVDEFHRNFLNPVLESLAGMNSDAAWEVRELKFSRQPETEESMRSYQIARAVSLAGLDSERAWDMRGPIPLGQVGYSMAGSHGRKSEDLRNVLELAGQWESLANSLVGVDSLSADAWRNKFPSTMNPFVRLGAFAGVASVKTLEKARKILSPKEQKNTAMHLNWPLPAGLRKLGLI